MLQILNKTTFST